MSEARKNDAIKVRMDLLPFKAIEMLGKVMTYGANKYADHDWRKGIKHSRRIAAMLRHAFALAGGEDIDPESGLPHAAHVMANAGMLLETSTAFDDRWKAFDDRDVRADATINCQDE